MPQNMKDISLTLGPVLFNWPVEQWRDFYFHMADEAPIDHVVVGEVVCSKREPFFTPHLPDVIERLESAGKSVTIASPILVMNKRERAAVDGLFSTGYSTEVNDMTALQMIGGNSFNVGPFINIYNESTRAYFERLGAERICLPGELPLTSIEAIAKTAKVPIEVFAFGRMPLAISARCYHARAQGLSKDSCRYVCAEDLDGMNVATLDGDDFLSVNGVQTLSHTYHNVITDLDTLAAAGISALRLSPHSFDMVEVARLFRGALDGETDTDEAAVLIADLCGEPSSNGFLYGTEGFKAEGGLEGRGMDTNTAIPA